jgi:FMN phosphatase YigB (HAD superfamily)
MKNIKNIIFDLDDTLIPCGVYYVERRRKFAEVQSARTGLPVEFCEQLLIKLDVACTALPGGFSTVRFPRSFRATSIALDAILGKPSDYEAAQEAFELGDSVFDVKPMLFDGVRDMLVKYKSLGYRLFLLTKGAETVQKDKIRLNKLDELIGWENIHIVGRKREEEMRKLIEDHALKIEETVMVGDSLKDDMGAALSVGMKCIWVDKGESQWAYEDSKNKPTVTIESATQLPKHVKLTEEDRFKALKKEEIYQGEYKGTGKFTDDELIYSATAKCKGCNAGMAYPKNVSPFGGFWDCSDVLTGRKPVGREHITYSFMYYEIKSENQPSAQGATTRPK